MSPTLFSLALPNLLQWLTFYYEMIKICCGKIQSLLGTGQSGPVTKHDNHSLGRPLALSHRVTSSILQDLDAAVILETMQWCIWYLGDVRGASTLKICIFVGRNHISTTKTSSFRPPPPTISNKTTRLQYYLRYDLIDRPGVLGNYVPLNYHCLCDLSVLVEGFWLSINRVYNQVRKLPAVKHKCYMVFIY